MKMHDLLTTSCLLNLLLGAAVHASDDVIKAIPCPSVCSCQLSSDASITSSQDKVVSVDCSDRDLVEIPGGIPRETRTLDLRGNFISEIGVETVFERYESLAEVDFSFNNISRLETVVEFLNWSRVKSLNLECNFISEVPPEAFGRNSELEHLALSNNRLMVLNGSCFGGLQKLRYLSLRINRIRALTAENFKGLSKLETLLLDDNLLTELADSVFEALVSLVNISLSHNEVETVNNAGLAGLARLQRVDLSHNLLKSTIPHTVSALGALKEVIFDGNRIQILNKRSFYKASVSDISLSKMPYLAIVDEAAFYDLNNLEILRLNGNPNLSYVHPRAFLKVEKLRILYLDNNNLIAVQGQLIASFPVLEALSLSENPLHCDCNVKWIRQKLEMVDRQQEIALNKSTLGPGGVTLVDLLLPDVERVGCESPAKKPLRMVRLEVLEDDECQPVTIPFFVGTTLAEINKNVTLSCRAVGTPQPTIHWILPNRKTVNSTSNSNRIRFYPSGTLTVENLKSMDHGTYTCWASNSKGHDASSTYMHIYSLSISLLLTEVGPTFASISWNGTEPTATSGGYVIQYRQCNRPVLGSSCRTYQRVELNPSMKGLSVTNLEPNSRYEFCICSENSDRRELDVTISCVQVETKEDVFSLSAISSLLMNEFTVIVASVSVVLLISCPALLFVQRQKQRRNSYQFPETSAQDTAVRGGGGGGETLPGAVESTATSATNLVSCHSSSVRSSIPLRCLLGRPTAIFSSSSKHSSNSRTSLLEPC